MEDILQEHREHLPPTQKPTQSTSVFEFKGAGLEYFKIWIVNMVLTIVTLGIYSAWATVRNNRYFYSNLYLDNHNFSYLAQPLTILKGRVLALITFAIFAYISQTNLLLSVGLSLIFLIAVPYIVIQSLKFSRRMTSYRNIQFRFSASYGEAFMVIIVWPILSILTIGILYPLAMVKMSKFIMSNTSYGTSNFDFKATYSDYGIIMLTMVGVGLVLGLPIWAVGFMFPSLTPFIPLISMFIYLGLILYFVVQTNNLFFNKLSLLEHSFKGTFDIISLSKVILTNIFLIIITLGLYIPAAKVRMVKYAATHVSINMMGSLDTFQSADNQQTNALGEELGNVFELGI